MYFVLPPYNRLNACVRLADLQLEILRLLSAAWDARADAPSAAAELREWASYCRVSRAWRAHFATRPLRLAFNAPLSTAQARALPQGGKTCFHLCQRISLRKCKGYGTTILDKCVGLRDLPPARCGWLLMRR